MAHGTIFPNDESVVCHRGVVESCSQVDEGRRNEELDSDGRGADSDHHVFPVRVRLDVQPHGSNFIPGADVDDIPQRRDCDDQLSATDGFNTADRSNTADRLNTEHRHQSPER